jgi:hypothetical protein
LKNSSCAATIQCPRELFSYCAKREHWIYDNALSNAVVMYRRRSIKGWLEESERQHGQLYWITETFAWTNWERPPISFIYPVCRPRIEKMMTYWTRSRTFLERNVGWGVWQPDLGSRQQLCHLPIQNNAGVKRRQLEAHHPILTKYRSPAQLNSIPTPHMGFRCMVLVLKQGRFKSSKP